MEQIDSGKKFSTAEKRQQARDLISSKNLK
jgi:hypothetical protein